MLTYPCNRIQKRLYFLISNEIEFFRPMLHREETLILFYITQYNVRWHLSFFHNIIKLNFHEVKYFSPYANKHLTQQGTELMSYILSNKQPPLTHLAITHMV